MSTRRSALVAAVTVVLALAGCSGPSGGGGAPDGGSGGGGAGGGTAGGGGNGGGGTTLRGVELVPSVGVILGVRTAGSGVYVLYQAQKTVLAVSASAGAAPKALAIPGCSVPGGFDVDPAGDAFVVCNTTSQTPGQEIELVRYDGTTGTLGSPEAVPSPGPTADDGVPGVYADAAGDAYVAFQHGGSQLYAVERSPTGTWGTPVRIDGGPNGPGVWSDPLVAGDPAGGAVAVWADAFGGNLWATRLSGTWQAPEKIDSAAGDPSQVQAEVNAAGDVVVLSGHDGGLDAMRYLTGSGWSAAVQVDTGHGAVKNVESAAIAPDGSAVALWTEGASDAHMFVSRAPAGGSFSAARQLDQSASAEYGGAAYAGSGLLAVAWGQIGTQIGSAVLDLETASGGGALGTATSFDQVGSIGTDQTYVLFPGGDKPALVWVAVDGAGSGDVSLRIYRTP